MITKKTLGKIEKQAKHLTRNFGPSHDWSHVERVTKRADFLAKKENANRHIVKVASLLHDIGRYSLKEIGYDHAVEGARLAKKILRNYPEISEKDKENIVHSIECHRFRNSLIPKTKEAKCLHDADKLDNLGAIGIARSYIYLGETMDCVIYMKAKKEKNPDKRRTNSVQEEYEIKYKHLPGKLTTAAGRKIARERLKYMQSYLGRLEKEVFGRL